MTFLLEAGGSLLFKGPDEKGGVIIGWQECQSLGTEQGPLFPEERTRGDWVLSITSCCSCSQDGGRRSAGDLLESLRCFDSSGWETQHQRIEKQYRGKYLITSII